jgi:hypothetical protein
MHQGTTDRRGLVSVDGEEYIPRREHDELRQERDRLASEVEQLCQELAESRDEEG